jgi:hypothetical protein
LSGSKLAAIEKLIDALSASGHAKVHKTLAMITRPKDPGANSRSDFGQI